MKLIYCPQCGDIVRLMYEKRYCPCMQSGGFYNKDGSTIVVWGQAKVIGLSNSFFTIGGADSLAAAGVSPIFWYPEHNGRVTRRKDAP